MKDFTQPEYEEVNFAATSPKFIDEFELCEELLQHPRLLTKNQQDQILYSINLQQNQNLLDLTCEQQQTAIQTMRYREFINDRECQISGPVTIKDGYFLTYKLYKVKTQKANCEDFETTVERRFSDFQYLHNKLVQNFGGCVIPCLPEKNMWASLDMESELDRKTRKKMLEKYINRLLQHQKLRYTEEVKSFLFDNEKSFSMKKGEFSAQNRMEDKIIRFTTSMYQSGKSIANYYLFYDQHTEISQKTLNNHKYSEVLHYQMVVDEMAKTLTNLKVVIDCTVTENNAYEKINGIVENLLSEDDQQILEEQTENEDGYSSAELLVRNQYENLVEFIMSCKEALDRWSKLNQELKRCKVEQKQLIESTENNPRNLKLDLVRSRIFKNSKKIEDWTRDLLSELQTNIMVGKSLINQFLNQLGQVRASTYSIKPQSTQLSIRNN